MFRSILIFCLVIITLTPVALVSLVIDSQPLVSRSITPGPEDAQKAKALLKQLLHRQNRHKPVTFSATAAELNAITAFLSRGSDRLTGQVYLSQQGLDGSFSIRLPKTPLGEYINLSWRVAPSDTGLAIDQITLGGLNIPGALALQTAQTGADLLLGEQLGRQLLSSIKKVSFAPGKMTVIFSSGAQLSALKKRLQTRLLAFRDDEVRHQKRDKIRFYYQQLSGMGQLAPDQKKVSLTHFMAPLFALAETRSRQASPVEENEAALFALAIYLGSHQFEKFTGSMDGSEKRIKGARPGHVVLGGRKDLRLHFLVSAGLKQLADAEIGFVIGEFKELLDSGKGGSGFSFIDLAADRAGLAFSSRATASPESARKFQSLMARTTDETSYFPDFSDLEEGLDQKHFAEYYADIDSERYVDIVRLIDQRLENLPLYR